MNLGFRWCAFWAAVNLIISLLYASESITTMASLHGFGFVLFTFLAWYESKK